MSGAELLCTWLPAVPFALTLLNVATWPRGRPDPARRPRVSVLIPARNEERNIERCVRAALTTGYALHEVIVYDDQSTDSTSHILEALQREAPALRVVRGDLLPAGWVGKAHACHRLVQLASGDVLLFVDADTELQPGGVARILSLLYPRRGSGADVVSAVPRQRMQSFGERLLVPLLHLTYTSWLPLLLVQHSRDPRFVAANGQLLAIRHEVAVLLGGFSAVASEIVDDVAFCRHAKVRGAKVVFADGFRVARCRMYRSFREVWSGFSKNLYEGLGSRPLRLGAVMALYLGAFVAPYVVLALALLLPGWAALAPAAAFGVALNLALRALLALRFRQPLEGVLLHPLGVLALCGVALNSYRCTRRGALAWAGRTYAQRTERLARRTAGSLTAGTR
ncbi:MAG TPA: glycosyltransferase family 2 protein [Polyangiales bacterium]